MSNVDCAHRCAVICQVSQLVDESINQRVARVFSLIRRAPGCLVRVHTPSPPASERFKQSN